LVTTAETPLFYQTLDVSRNSFAIDYALPTSDASVEFANLLGGAKYSSPNFRASHTCVATAHHY
jgi:hypothetical protein